MSAVGELIPNPRAAKCCGVPWKRLTLQQCLRHVLHLHLSRREHGPCKATEGSSGGQLNPQRAGRMLADQTSRTVFLVTEKPPPGPAQRAAGAEAFRQVPRPRKSWRTKAAFQKPLAEGEAVLSSGASSRSSASGGTASTCPEEKNQPESAQERSEKRFGRTTLHLHTRYDGWRGQ